MRGAAEYSFEGCREVLLGLVCRSENGCESSIGELQGPGGFGHNGVKG